MLPRTRAEADPQAGATIASLQRYYEYQQQPKRHSNWGPIIFALAIGWVAAILFMSRTKNADPLADARLNNAPNDRSAPVATPTPIVMRAQLVQFAPRPIGDNSWVRLPDGRSVWTKVCPGVKSLTDLPRTGNHLGDMRYVSEADGFWVWTTLIGSNVPTWIDP
jgi:hypothetical protein